jgi:kynureninase
MTLHGRSRATCLELDANDELAPLRELFSLPAGVLYFDGNSLGPLPKAAVSRAHEVLAREWGEGLVRSWNEAHWYASPERLGAKLAPLLGALPDEVVVADSTSINLFKAVAGALHIQSLDAPARRKIVSERSNFPSDLYVIEGLCHWIDRGYEVVLVDGASEIESALDQDCALLALTHVNYRTGAMHDLARLSALAHQCGALIVWDLAHSAGALPLDLQRDGADFAVGCTYKYLNGGPGAPAYIWIAKRHHERFSQPLKGWWSHATPFTMDPNYIGASGVAKAKCGTPPVLSMALVECGLDVFANTTMSAIREKSLRLGDLFIDLVASRCASYPLRLVTPQNHALRGSQISYEHPQGFGLMQALIRRGLIGDYRHPNIIRFGLTPLYMRYVDVWNAVTVLEEVLSSGEFQAQEPAGAVT